MVGCNCDLHGVHHGNGHPCRGSGHHGHAGNGYIDYGHRRLSLHIVGTVGAGAGGIPPRPAPGVGMVGARGGGDARRRSIKPSKSLEVEWKNQAHPAHVPRSQQMKACPTLTVKFLH